MIEGSMRVLLTNRSRVFGSRSSISIASCRSS
jgi:hypothetical protein